VCRVQEEAREEQAEAALDREPHPHMGGARAARRDDRGAGLRGADGGGDEGRRATSLRQDPVISEASEVSVAVVDDDYEPRELTVRPGTTITWKFEGDRPHTITDDRDRFDSGTLDRGAEWVQTFDEPGEYFYYCVLHHAMLGTVRVEPGDGPGASDDMGPGSSSGMGQ
jgi:plastocyanin